MAKSPDAFRSIGEVSRLVGVAPHVLRYWEGQFTQLSPVKRADGRRYYRPDDVRLVAGLCQVLREEGLSIRGAKRLISADRGAGLREIGAARLGERPTGQKPAPAVRLARPGDSPTPPIQVITASDADDAEPLTPNSGTEFVTTATTPPRKRARPVQPADSLPLFPDLGQSSPAEWLARLGAVAVPLRTRLTAIAPLPEQAAALRERLATAR